MKSKKILFYPEEKKSITFLAFILFFRLFGVFILLPIFSSLALDLDFATPALIGLALGIYGLSQGVLQIPFGILSDKFGRKKILIIGLLLFLFGCLLAAFAQDIYTMIIARFLQGLGAVSSTIFALIADNTRDEVRTRANAFLGLGAGMAFGIAFCVAPFIANYFDFKGIFLVISVTIIISMILVLLLDEKKQDRKSISSKAVFLSSIQNKSLYPVYIGSFIVSAGLTTTFFLIPIVTREMGWNAIELWKLYIPLLFVSALVMFPATFIAEAKKKYKAVMLFGTLIITLSMCFGLLYFQNSNPIYIFVFLYLFFIGFNIFEPIFPSLVTKMSDKDSKGASSGVYNFCQFTGQFFGATMMGFFYQEDPVFPFLFLIILLVIYSLILIFQKLSLQKQ